MQVSVGSPKQRAYCVGNGGPGPCLGHISGPVKEEDLQKRLRRRIPRRKRETSRECVSRCREWVVVSNHLVGRAS